MPKARLRGKKKHSIRHDYGVANSSCTSPQKSRIAAAAAKSLQSCPTLCDPIDGSPPGSSDLISIKYTLKRESVSCSVCPTIWDPMDCSSPDASVHGILQAIIYSQSWKIPWTEEPDRLQSMGSGRVEHD